MELMVCKGIQPVIVIVNVGCRDFHMGHNIESPVHGNPLHQLQMDNPISIGMWRVLI